VRTALEDANDAFERADFATASALYEALAKDGHANTLVPLARMYIDGKGGAVDLGRAEALPIERSRWACKRGCFKRQV
jgi:TPR repeat protein